MIQSKIVNRVGVPAGVRLERVVHSLDGLEVPVSPPDLRSAAEDLWRKYLDGGHSMPDFLLGLDSGGIVPTVALSLLTGIPFKLAYKIALDIPNSISFREPNAVTKAVHVYNLQENDRLVIVDDETYTGETLESCVEALTKSGVVVLGCLCMVEDTRFGAKIKLAKWNVPLISLSQPR